jgi:hypothetical protein
MAVLTVEKDDMALLQRVLVAGEGVVPCRYKKLSYALVAPSSRVLTVQFLVSTLADLDGIVDHLYFAPSQEVNHPTNNDVLEEVRRPAYIGHRDLSYHSCAPLHFMVPEHPQVDADGLRQTLINAARSNLEHLTGVDLFTGLDSWEVPVVQYVPEEVASSVGPVCLTLWWSLPSAVFEEYVYQLRQELDKARVPVRACVARMDLSHQSFEVAFDGFPSCV